MVWIGVVCSVLAGTARRVLLSQGLTWQVRQGRLGKVGRVSVGLAWHGRLGKEIKNMTYKWKTGYHSKVKAEIAGEVFKELEQTVGLTPKNLVDASRDENAPMHSAFEWDDAIAGEKWRIQEARTHINHLEIVIETHAKKPTTRAYVMYDTAKPYEDIKTVLADPVKSNQFFEMGMKMLTDFKRRYSEVKEFAQIITDIETLERSTK